MAVLYFNSLVPGLHAFGSTENFILLQILKMWNNFYKSCIDAISKEI